MSDTLPAMQPSMFDAGNTQSLAPVPEYLKSDAASTNSLVTGFVGVPTISIRGKQFRYTKHGQDIVVPMGVAAQVVILAADPPQGVAKGYYEKGYTQGDDSPPDCGSATGIVPDGFFQKPQSRSCSECPHNEFGTGRNQQGEPTRGKRCSDYKNLFVLLADDLEGDIYCIRVPATSFKSLSKLGRDLGNHQVDMWGVRTQIAFADEDHSQLVFTAVGYLDQASSQIATTRVNSPELKSALPSLNQQGSATPAPAPLAEAPPLPSPPAAASTPPPPSPDAAAPIPPPPVPAAEPKKVMTEAAGGITYDAFMERGWTDEQLLAHKYMIVE